MSSISETASPYPPATASIGSTGVWRLVIDGVSEPGLLSRILEQFAKRTLMPKTFMSRCRTPSDRARMKVSVTIEADDHVITHIARCIEQFPGVKTVSLK